MLTWPEIILLLLRIVNNLMTLAQENKWMQAGKDAEIAKVSADILRKTEAGRAILEKVNALSDADVDAQLRGLEPK